MSQTRASAGSSTVQLTADQQQQQESLKLTKKKKRALARQVAFTANTVDNEGMGKKTSKCCCVYVKPSKFGEDEEEDEDDCANCRGHVKPRREDSSAPGPGQDAAGPSTG